MNENKAIKKANVYEKLQNARVMLQEKNNKKSGKNKFANFNYYELADFMPSVNEIFKQQGLFSMFNIRDGVATLVIINIEEPIDTITFESPIAEAEIKGSTPIQCLGGIHTYMKRYLYLNALEIVESDMFDGKVGDKTLKEGKIEVEKNYRDELVKFCQDNDKDMNEIAQKYRINAKSSNEHFKNVLEALEELKNVELENTQLEF